MTKSREPPPPPKKKVYPTYSQYQSGTVFQNFCRRPFKKIRDVASGCVPQNVDTDPSGKNKKKGKVRFKDRLRPITNSKHRYLPIWMVLQTGYKGVTESSCNASRNLFAPRYRYRCSGSVTFWYGSGSERIRITKLRIRILFFSLVISRCNKFCCLLLAIGIFTSILK